jgi:uncharacterized protein YbcV (DUF1398 family)
MARDHGASIMDTTVAHACKQGSLDGTLTFPQVVARLQGGGVERYYADLVRRETVYYGVDGDAHGEALPLSGLPAVADAFDEAGVRTALAAVQQGRIRYPEFLQRIMAAGTASYTVFIQGRTVVYSGRHGDAYVEAFPGPQ